MGGLQPVNKRGEHTHTHTHTHTNLNQFVTVEPGSRLTGRDSYSTHEWNKFPVKHTLTKVIVSNQPPLSRLQPVILQTSVRRDTVLLRAEGREGGRSFISGAHQNQFAGLK